MKKGSKIVIQVSVSVADTFGGFITSRKAKGLSEKTLTAYKQHLAAIGKHLDVTIPIDELIKQDFEGMISGFTKFAACLMCFAIFDNEIRYFLENPA